jgi:hypothetical protein
MDKINEETIDLAMNAAVATIEAYLITNGIVVTPEEVEQVAERVADKIKSEHAAGRSTY